MDVWQRRLRWGSLLLGGMMLFWLPVEDTQFVTPLSFGVAICGLGAIALKNRLHILSAQYIWLGLAAGGAVGPISFLLMVFKIGLHNHNSPDFTLEQLLGLVKVAPIWGIVGALMGLGLHLYFLSRSE